MERLGFFVCEEDLEDELIRASDRVAIEALLDSQGDFGSFQTLRKQPAWRQEGFEAQMRRWLGAGARRKPRYAHLVSLGATRIDIGQGDVDWVVMADPEGNEFCVLSPAPRAGDPEAD